MEQNVFQQDSRVDSTLQALGVELDQKLRTAIEFAHGSDPERGFDDAEVFHALNRLNTVSTRLVDIDAILQHPRGEARVQLLEYRDWFEDRENRQRLKSVLGMEVYRPCLAVVIGRASEFTNEYDRQKLVSRESDLEIVTYDDILAYARRRLLFVET